MLECCNDGNCDSRALLLRVLDIRRDICTGCHVCPDVGSGDWHIFTLIAPVAARVIGLVELPAGLSVIWVSIVAPALFAEPIALGLKRTTGKIYLHAQIFAGCMFLTAAFCVWLVRALKINEIRRLEDEEQKETATCATQGPTLHRVLAHKTTSESSLCQRIRWMKFVEWLQGLLYWERI